MRTNLIWSAVLTVALIGCILPALAGPPYNVDDPGTAEYQHIEENTAYVTNRVTGSDTAQPQTEVNYGYSKNIQLTLGSGLISERASGQRRTTGASDTSAEFKWRFLEETPRQPAVSLHYFLKIPTERVVDGGTGRYDNTLLAAAGKNYGKFFVFSQLGFSHPGAPDQKDTLAWGLATSYQLTGNTTLGAQVYGSSSAASGQNGELAWGVTATRDLVPDRTLMVQVGHSTQGFSDLNVYVGIQFILNTRHSSEKAVPDAKDAPSH